MQDSLGKLPYRHAALESTGRLPYNSPLLDAAANSTAAQLWIDTPFMFLELTKNTPWPQQVATRTALGPFFGSAESRCIAELADPNRLLLVITADSSSAIALERELAFYLDKPSDILAFPDW